MCLTQSTIQFEKISRLNIRELSMLRIRLRRVGAKKHPLYRIVVADSRAPRDGSFVDQVGHYNPHTDPPTVDLDEEKITKWLSNGAQPSEPVQGMLERVGIINKSDS
jgi:small subunit ribosomal protein S16